MKHEELKNILFEISGPSDSDYAKDEEKCRSVTGKVGNFEGVPISANSKMQERTALSVSESEAIAGSADAQDMLFAASIVESIGLKVKYPMTLFIDNRGAIDLFNNYSVGGRTRHMQARVWFMRDLREQGKMIYKWIRSEDNYTDIFTKNLDGATYNKHAQHFVGKDKYM